MSAKSSRKAGAPEQGSPPPLTVVGKEVKASSQADWALDGLSGISRTPKTGFVPQSLDLIRFTIGMLAFFHGLNESSKMPIFYFQKNVLQFTAETAQLISSLMIIPQFVKPFSGYFLDLYVHRGYSLVTLVTLVEVAKASISLWLGTGPMTASLFIGLLITRRILLIFDALIAEVVLGSITKEQTIDNEDPKANEFPIFYIWKAVGGVVGIALSSWLISIGNERSPFLMSAATPLVIILYLQLLAPRLNLATESAREAEHHLATPLDASPVPGPVASDSSRTSWFSTNTVASILYFLGRRSVFPLLGFVVLFSLNPDFGHVIEFYSNDVLKFSHAHMASFFIVHCLFIFTVVFYYSRAKQWMSTKVFYAISTVIAIGLHMGALLIFSGFTAGLAPQIQKGLAIFIFAGLSSLEDINFPALLAHISRSCPSEILATTLAVVSCLVRGAWHLAQYFGSLLTGALEIADNGFERAWVIPVINSYYLMMLFMLLLVLPLRAPSLRSTSVIAVATRQ